MTDNTGPVRVGLIGSGWIGRFHGESLARRIPETDLVAVADPAPGSAERVAGELGAGHWYTDAADLITDPEIEAVVIASPARFHTDLVVAAAQAGKAIFVEKPMALTIADADRAIGAAASAGLPLQVGFNRRFATGFAAARRIIDDGGIGTPQLLRSLTRDPGGFDPAAVRPGTIFLETLIHDFDTLRWLNPGASVVDVYAVADALVHPQWRDRGLLDTAVVTIRFDNGAIATAEANFSAAYGYDVRGEVFGSAGMVTAGDVRAGDMRHYHAGGVSSPTTRLNIDLFRDAYTQQLADFAANVRGERRPVPTGEDAREALAIALAAIESVRSGARVAIGEVTA